MSWHKVLGICYASNVAARQTPRKDFTEGMDSRHSVLAKVSRCGPLIRATYFFRNENGCALSALHSLICQKFGLLG